MGLTSKLEKLKLAGDKGLRGKNHHHHHHKHHHRKDAGKTQEGQTRQAETEGENTSDVLNVEPKGAEVKRTESFATANEPSDDTFTEALRQESDDSESLPDRSKASVSQTRTEERRATESSKEGDASGAPTAQGAKVAETADTTKEAKGSSQGKEEEELGISSQGNTDDIDEVDNEGQSILMSIISQLKPGCDLSRITLPTFILEKKSMLERITNFFQIPELLIDANKKEDPLERFIAITKWYLACWHVAPKAVKKPLNPVLGEIFACYWDKLPQGNDAYFVSEQTSHHPPKSSYFYLMPDEKIRVDGVVVPISKFLVTSTAAIMNGWGHVTLGKHGDEEYIMNQPNVYCRGILFGKLRYELGDQMVITCPKIGYEATIDFKTKGFLSGTYDAIEGVIKKTLSSKPLYEISGKWNEVMNLKDVASGKKSVLYDTSVTRLTKPSTRPLAEQWDYESRKLWLPTIRGLAKRDHKIATDEKFKVEDEQRQLAKERAQKGEEFHPKIFLRLQDTSDKSLEYKIFRDFDLKDEPALLRKEVLDTMAFLPGQLWTDKYCKPAEEKASR